MLAYVRQIVTVEKVVQTVRRFAAFNASSELPSSVEDALLFWINKVCVAVQLSVNKEDNQVLEGETNQKVQLSWYLRSLCFLICCSHRSRF